MTRDMSFSLAQRMIALNSSFYRTQAGDFSATRQSAWLGWERVLQLMLQRNPQLAGECDPRLVSQHAPHSTTESTSHSTTESTSHSTATHTPSLSVVDIACGNQRFRRFVKEKFPHTQLSYVGVDNCRPLVEGCGAGEPPMKGVGFGSLVEGEGSGDGSSEALSFVEFDVANTLLKSTLHLAVPPADLAVSFGFMHHVPTFDARIRLLLSLLSLVHSRGLAVVTLWRFMDNPSLAVRARETTARGLRELDLSPQDLGSNDYLLGWQHQSGVFRYCHYVDDDEVRQLVNALPSTTLVDTFVADGRDGRLNRYLVFMRHDDHENAVGLERNDAVAL